METQYFIKSSSTGLVTTVAAAVAFLAANMTSVYPVQAQETISYEQYANWETQKYSESSSNEKDEESKILVSFAQMLFNNSKEDDFEIAKITSDGFWEFHENF